METERFEIKDLACSNASSRHCSREQSWLKLIPAKRLLDMNCDKYLLSQSTERPPKGDNVTLGLPLLHDFLDFQKIISVVPCGLALLGR
jgi:hypothetical protein